MKISCHTELKQLIIIVMSVIAVILCLPVLYFNQTLMFGTVFVFVIASLISVNYVLSKLYNIEVEKGEIILKNLYYNRTVPISEFKNISTTKLKIFLPILYNSPPFFYVNLKNGKKFLFECSIKNTTKFIIPLNGNKIAEKLTSDINNFIVK